MLATNKVRAIAALTALPTLKNARVLELAAEPPFEAAKELLAWGVGEVLATNIRYDMDTTDLPKGLIYQYADAHNLAATMPEDSVDCVFATAFLEHVHDIPAMLSSVAHVLKPGGFAYLAGSPIWSSKSGHHLWVNTSLGHIRFYDKDRVLKPFEHIITSPEDLRRRVAERRPFTDEDLDKIIDKIYTHPSINRVPSNLILDAIKTGPLEPVSITLRQTKRRQKNLKAAKKALGPGINPRIFGIEALLKKPSDTSSTGAASWKRSYQWLKARYLR